MAFGGFCWWHKWPTGPSHFNGIWWVYHKKCATAEQKWCMQYVFIIYMHRNCKIPCRFLGILSWRRFCRFSSTRNILSIFLGSMTWALYCKPRNHQNSFYPTFKPLGQSQTIPKNPPSRNSYRDFFSISLFTLSVSTPQKTTKNLKKKHHSYPFPPGKKTDPPNKKKSTPTTIPPGDSSRDLFIPLEVTNNLFKGSHFHHHKKGHKRIARWFGFQLNPRNERDC